jgi:hypothetical protein
MRRLVIVGFALAAGLAGTTRLAHANGCNLYTPQRTGQIREGCSMTVYNLPEVAAALPTIKRGGVELTPTIVHDQISMQVTFEHYQSSTVCDLIESHEDRTFDRYVISWADLHGGDEVNVDDSPYTTVVPGPGDCGAMEAFFYCADPIQTCTPPMDPIPDPNPEPDNDDLGGCAAGGGSPGWLALLGVAAFVSCSRRSRASSRR